MEIQRGGKREGSGRKKGFAALAHEKARELLSVKLFTEFGPIVDKAIEQAKNGDNEARKWLSDRAWGRPKDTMDMNVIPFSLRALCEAREKIKR